MQRLVFLQWLPAQKSHAVRYAKAALFRSSYAQVYSTYATFPSHVWKRVPDFLCFRITSPVPLYLNCFFPLPACTITGSS